MSDHRRPGAPALSSRSRLLAALLAGIPFVMLPAVVLVLFLLPGPGDPADQPKQTLIEAVSPSTVAAVPAADGAGRP